jgi:urease accessory protein
MTMLPNWTRLPNRLRSATITTATIALTIGLSPLAQAHVQTGHPLGFFHGLGHPLGGLDHILAMVGVGLWAAQLGGQALWLLPTIFVSVMAIGGTIGLTGLSLPFIEPGILLSDLVFGLVILGAARWPRLVSTSLVALFALFHGYAHGAEMPANALVLHYGFGFMASTAFLHLVGLGAVIGLQWFDGSDRLVRLVGGGISIAGLGLMVQAL